MTVSIQDIGTMVHSLLTQFFVDKTDYF